ncbi:MAG: CDP-alcohol phosphatidyltransferase family protein [Rhodospirillum sp.]|nr:CDP-alcohol phosphatidyltransferase family protein [Rhodospirillum sp.]MCF8490512.1 CDP-alcohol phosphatidyltransferase family protein [Rhodospirillum sp.]MCF8500631.1 CDP-alcohol phosphatidyltransferase family protein [Rhodospirillum sp.]
MLDRHVRPQVDPTLNRVARWLAARSLTANQLTVLGFLIGMAAVPLLAAQQSGLALGAILLNRVLDGLDGALARSTAPTPLGGFLDITLDFLFYAAVPLGFALADPATNGLPSAFLLFCFIGTGSSFLAFASIAAKEGLDPDARQGPKAIHYLGGLTEGTETIAALVLFCLFPESYPWLATGFGILCLITVGTRIWVGYRTFKDR